MRTVCRWSSCILLITLFFGCDGFTPEPPTAAEGNGLVAMERESFQLSNYALTYESVSPSPVGQTGSDPMRSYQFQTLPSGGFVQATYQWAHTGVTVTSCSVQPASAAQLCSASGVTAQIQLKNNSINAQDVQVTVTLSGPQGAETWTFNFSTNTAPRFDRIDAYVVYGNNHTPSGEWLTFSNISGNTVTISMQSGGQPVTWSNFRMYFEDDEANLVQTDVLSSSVEIEWDWAEYPTYAMAGAYIWSSNGDYINVKATDAGGLSTTVSINFEH